MRRRRRGAVVSPAVIGAATVLVALVGVVLAYNANRGLPLPELDPLLKELPGRLTPLRTLATEGREPLRQTRATIETLEPLLGDLSDTAKVLQHVGNVLGYDPPGDEKGFSYYLAWFGHNTNSVFSTQDANGPAWRGQLLLSCSSLGGIDALQPVTLLLSGLGVCR